MVADECDGARTWRPWVDVALFGALRDPAWAFDRERIDHELRETWGSEGVVVEAGRA
jgi:hypothetical protein